MWGISGLDGDKSTCFSIDGLAQCTLFFDFEKPIQQASQDVRDAISTKREDLPPEMKEPILTRFDPSEAPVFTLVLTSPSTPAPVLTRIADPGLASDLRSIAGRRAGERRGRGEAQHGRGAAPRGSAVGGCERRAGRCGARAAESRVAGRVAERQPAGEADPPERPPQECNRLRQSRRRGPRWRADSARIRSRTSTMERKRRARWRSSTASRRWGSRS